MDECKSYYGKNKARRVGESKNCSNERVLMDFARCLTNEGQENFNNNGGIN